MAPGLRSRRCGSGSWGRCRFGLPDGTLRVPGTRRRALLPCGRSGRGQVVGTERLIDTLWLDDPPANAAQALHSHVSRLRGRSTSGTEGAMAFVPASSCPERSSPDVSQCGAHGRGSRCTHAGACW